jgi:hypothetical protein
VSDKFLQYLEEVRDIVGKFKWIKGLFFIFNITCIRTIGWNNRWRHITSLDIMIKLYACNGSVVLK